MGPDTDRWAGFSAPCYLSLTFLPGEARNLCLFHYSSLRLCQDTEGTLWGDTPPKRFFTC